MDKNKICTSAYFIELYRWFTQKLDSWKKEHNPQNDDWEPWTVMLKNSHVYCREDDENGNPTGNWFRITNFEDHGPNVTLVIKKPDGKIEV